MSALRFNYLYSEQELEEFAEPIQELASKTKRVHAMFNNCYMLAGINSRRLIRHLQEACITFGQFKGEACRARFSISAVMWLW